MSGLPRGPKSFDSSKAPVGYIAGLGRGAVGFTTRSDIGPASQAAAAGRGAAPVDKTDYSESNYDSFGGYSEKLFNSTPYDDDDVAADEIYSAIDERMDSRWKRHREDTQNERIKKARTERPAISAQLAPFKQALATVTADEWLAIPDTGDHSIKYKNKTEKQGDAYTPLSDKLLDQARHQGSGNITHSLDAKQQLLGGFATPMTNAGNQSTLVGLAGARGTVLKLKLDKMGDSVTGQTVVDPKGYLTDLNSVNLMSDADVSDVKKARQLLKSVITTNPGHAPGWIAAARLEERQGKLVAARKLMKSACDACSKSEDVWLERCRLQTPENARVILAEASRVIPGSVKIWTKAAELETSVKVKKRVLRRGLEIIPESVILWKAAVELENVEDAKIMLSRAVECVPSSVDMWLALAKLESYENAQKVLNSARKALPTEPMIWITASQLEEAQGNIGMVDTIISNAVAGLKLHKAVISRSEWLKLAKTVEESGAPLTCGAIIRSTIGLEVEIEDRRRTWLADAEATAKSGHPATARAILAHALTEFPDREDMWLEAVALEKDHGTADTLEALLKQSVVHVPTSPVLWLMAAKHKWVIQQDVPGARGILREAFQANANDAVFQSSEPMWLAAVKLEWENGFIDRARAFLTKARERVSSSRVWMKSALLEWQDGNVLGEEAMLKEGLLKYPRFDKLWIMMGQLCDDLKEQPDQARLFYKKGIQNCPKSIPLWCLAAKLEEKLSGIAKARTVFEAARLKNPKNDKIWVESIRLEGRHNQVKSANTLLAKALQECSKSGLLWSESIALAARPLQRGKSRDALKACGNQNPQVALAVAKLFANERKLDKARRWFTRAAALEPDNGDIWLYYYKFESLYGKDAKRLDDVASKCAKVEPKHGELWPPFAKSKEGRKLDSVGILKSLSNNISL